MYFILVTELVTSSAVSSFWLATITGVLSGLLSSYIFLMYFLRFKKPKIAISNFISKLMDEETNDFVYTFKIINQTNCSIYSVKVDACFMTPTGADGGANLTIERIPLKYDNYSHIPRRALNDSHACHAVRIKCPEPLEKKWEKSSFLRLEVFAKHELSGFSRIFVKDYHNKSSIRNGEFKFGDDLSIT